MFFKILVHDSHCSTRITGSMDELVRIIFSHVLDNIVGRLIRPLAHHWQVTWHLFNDERVEGTSVFS